MSSVVADSPSVEQVATIETGRLRLRAHRADDAAACMAIWSDPEVVRYIGGRPFTAEKAGFRLWRQTVCHDSPTLVFTR